MKITIAILICLLIIDFVAQLIEDDRKSKKNK